MIWFVLAAACFTYFLLRVVWWARAERRLDGVPRAAGAFPPPTERERELLDEYVQLWYAAQRACEAEFTDERLAAMNELRPDVVRPRLEA